MNQNSNVSVEVNNENTESENANDEVDAIRLKEEIINNFAKDKYGKYLSSKKSKKQE